MNAPAVLGTSLICFGTNRSRGGRLRDNDFAVEGLNEKRDPVRVAQAQILVVYGVMGLRRGDGTGGSWQLAYHPESTRRP
jgi:hypothetical protein